MFAKIVMAVGFFVAAACILFVLWYNRPASRSQSKLPEDENNGDC